MTQRLDQADVSLAEATRSALRAKQADVAESTLTRYGEGLDHFLRHVGPQSPIAEALTTEQVREFKTARLQAGASHETINNDLGAVSILVSHAVERGWIRERPVIKRYDSTVRIWGTE